jgi:hypothetical protein
MDAEAKAWLAEHENELPQMSDGERIGGDPIICVGNGNDLELVDMLRRVTGRVDSSYRDDLILRGFISYYIKNPKNKQAAVLLLTAAGISQTQIAKTLGCTQQAVCKRLQLNKSVKQLIAKELAR